MSSFGSHFLLGMGSHRSTHVQFIGGRIAIFISRMADAWMERVRQYTLLEVFNILCVSKKVVLKKVLRMFARTNQKLELRLGWPLDSSHAICYCYYWEANHQRESSSDWRLGQSNVLSPGQCGDML